MTLMLAERGVVLMCEDPDCIAPATADDDYCAECAGELEE